MAGYAAPPTLESPPVPPEVSGQQQGASAQYLQSNQQLPGGSASSAMALAEQKLNQVASDLRDVAKILVTSKPAVIPIMQKALSALSMVMNEVQSGKGQGPQPGGQAAVQRQAPESQGQAPEEGSAPPPAM